MQKTWGKTPVSRLIIEDMNKAIKITSYKALVNFLEENELTPQEIAKVASEALKVVVFDEGKTSKDLIQDVKQYVKKIGATGGKSIFLNLPDLNVIN